jgi:hypothetical protein
MGKSLVYAEHPDGEMIFDFSTKIIHCAPSISFLEAEILYVACLDMEDTLIALTDPGIVNGGGKNELGEVREALTVTLLERKIYKQKTDGSRFTVGGGNVITQDPETGLTSPGIFSVNRDVVYVNNQAKNFVAGNLTGDMSAILRSLSDTIFYDPVNGTAGRQVGTGLPAQPSNNLADAIAIATTPPNAIRKMAILADLVINQAMPRFSVRSEGGNHLIVLTGTDTSASTFSDNKITGPSNGFTTFNFCTVGNVTGFVGQMRNCGLLMNIAIAPDPLDAPRFVDCFESDPTTSHPTLDMSAGEVTSASFIRYAGLLTVAGLNNGQKRLEMNMSGGQLTLDETCTDGIVLLTGNGAEPINNGTATIIKLGFVTDVSGGGSGDSGGGGATAANQQALSNQITAIDDKVRNFLEGLGRVDGVAVDQLMPGPNEGDTGYLTTSNGSIRQRIIRNADGSIRVESE